MPSFQNDATHGCIICPIHFVLSPLVGTKFFCAACSINISFLPEEMNDFFKPVERCNVVSVHYCKVLHCLVQACKPKSVESRVWEIVECALLRQQGPLTNTFSRTICIEVSHSKNKFPC